MPKCWRMWPPRSTWRINWRRWNSNSRRLTSRTTRSALSLANRFAKCLLFGMALRRYILYWTFCTASLIFVWSWRWVEMNLCIIESLFAWFNIFCLLLCLFYSLDFLKRITDWMWLRILCWLFNDSLCRYPNGVLQLIPPNSDIQIDESICPKTGRDFNKKPVTGVLL
jgi:hypothetical protein